MAILQWMIPHAADTINRFVVGDDGRTAYYRVRHKEFHGKVCEFGEQVLAKPKRSNKKIRKKGTLEPRFHDATWVGHNDRSNEHIVILKAGGPAIKVRTIRPTAEGDRWRASAIKEVMATPDAPNPKDESQKDLRSERNTKGLDFGASGGQHLPRQGVRHEPGLTRNFRVGNRILEKYGPTLGCKGCESKIAGEDARPHSSECRARLEELMRSDEEDAGVIARRDERRGPRAKTAAEAEEVKEETEEPPAAQQQRQQAARSSSVAPQQPAGRTDAQRKPEHEEQDEVRSKKQRVATISTGQERFTATIGRCVCSSQRCEAPSRALAKRDKIEASVKNALEQLIREGNRSAGALCTREVVKDITDIIEERCARKITKELSKIEATHTNSGVDLAEVYSPPRMMKQATKLGYSAGFVMDLTTKDEDGSQWDLSDVDMQRKADASLVEEAPWLLAISPPCTMFATIQALSFMRQDDEVIGSRMKEAMAHVGFVVKLCLMQAKEGRKFLIEQPAGVSSWGHSAHEQVVVRPGRGESEVRFLHVRNDVERWAQCWPRQKAGEHHHEVSSADIRVEKVPMPWRTQACHVARQQGQGLPDLH